MILKTSPHISSSLLLNVKRPWKTLTMLAIPRALWTILMMRLNVLICNLTFVVANVMLIVGMLVTMVKPLSSPPPVTPHVLFPDAKSKFT